MSKLEAFTFTQNNLGLKEMTGPGFKDRCHETQHFHSSVKKSARINRREIASSNPDDVTVRM